MSRLSLSTALRHERAIVFGLLAVGVLLRLVVAFATYGDRYDMGSHHIVEAALRHDPLDVYATLRWPYPPGFFGELLLSGAAARLTGLPFHGLVQVWSIAADALLALLVGDVLRRRGAAAPTRLVAIGAVALGPLFALVSGYHGQIDSAAILPAAAAVWWWERDGRRRGLVSGLLVGLGAATKTVPGVVALALLPTARTRRERIAVLAGAVGVPALLLVPFLLADAKTVLELLGRYRGVPGQGGISLLVQPELAVALLDGDRSVRYSAASRALQDLAPLFGLLGLAAIGAVFAGLVRKRVRAPEGALLLLLAGLATGPNLFYQYTVWVLPFALMAGFVRPALLLQVLGAISGALVSVGVHFGADSPLNPAIVFGIFVPVTLLVWLGYVAGLGYGAWRLRR